MAREDLECSTLCTFPHPAYASVPFDVVCAREPKGMILPAPYCCVAKTSLVEALQPLLPEMIVGRCILDRTGEEISGYRTFGCSQWHAVFARGGRDARYHTCSFCDYPYYYSTSQSPGYYLAEQFRNRDVRLAGSSICCVKSIAADLTRRFNLRFIEHEVLQRPIDGRILRDDPGYVVPTRMLPYVTPLPEVPDGACLD